MEYGLMYFSSLVCLVLSNFLLHYVNLQILKGSENVFVMTLRFLGRLLGITGIFLCTGFMVLALKADDSSLKESNTILTYSLVGYLAINFAINKGFELRAKKLGLIKTDSGEDTDLKNQVDALERNYILLKNAVDVKKFSSADEVKTNERYISFISDMDAIVMSLKEVETFGYKTSYITDLSNTLRWALNDFTGDKEPNDVIKVLCDSIKTFKGSVKF